MCVCVRVCVCVCVCDCVCVFCVRGEHACKHSTVMKLTFIIIIVIVGSMVCPPSLLRKCSLIDV